MFLGGANYLPSQAWQALCCIIPGLVVLGLLSSAFCAPIQLDWATAFHVLVTLCYFQLDLGLGRLLTGSHYGEICVPWMVFRELSPFPSTSSSTLAAKIKGKVPTPAFAKAPLFDFLIDLVSVTAHEIFWNIFICQNCLNYGMPVIVSILAVPTASCIVHGIVTSTNVGLRMFPQFLQVAMAYYASGSVIPPALIHHFWYLLDQKPLAVVKQAKREWDIEERRLEVSLSPWDHYSSTSLILTLFFYSPLIMLIHRFPALRSVGVASCHAGQFPKHAVDWILVVLFSLRILMLIQQWKLSLRSAIFVTFF